MTAAPLRVAGIRVTRDRLNEHRRRVPLDAPEVTLTLFTKGGADRSIILSEVDLVHMITGAAAALDALRLARLAAEA